jgi:alkylhydroperoxidase/carboxymuconolactone decarboxylase family protein YurZ
VAQSELTQREAELKAAFVAARGYWSPLWDGVLRLDPAYFEAYLGFSALPWERGPLEPKVKELIYTAIDISTTHLFEPGIRIHIANALAHGAAVEEVMEVFEIASVLGMDTLTVGVPILLEELATAGRHDELPAPRPDERRRGLKAEFVAVRGYWSELFDGVLALDPDFFEAFLRLAAVPWRGGVLEPKVRELVHVAIASACTHLHEPGLRIHIRNALARGATAGEVMEVFQLTSVLGVHSCTIGVPLLLEAAQPEGAGR